MEKELAEEVEVNKGPCLLIGEDEEIEESSFVPSECKSKADGGGMRRWEKKDLFEIEDGYIGGGTFGESVVFRFVSAFVANPRRKGQI